MFYKFTRGAVAVSALMTAQAAYAEVTAADVWAAIQDNVAKDSVAQLTSTGEATDGATTTYSGVEISSEEEGFKSTFTVGDLVLTENGDGTVDVTVPEVMTLTMGDAEGKNGATFEVRSANLVTTASGEPGAISYDSTADRLTIALTEATEEGAPVTADVQLNFNNMTQKSLMTKDDMETTDTQFAADAVDFLASFDDGEGSVVDASGQITAMQMGVVSSMAADAEVDPVNPFAGFINGGSVIGKSEAGSVNMLINVTDEVGTTNITLSSTDGSSNFAVGKDGFSFDKTVNGVAFAASGGSVPMPLDLSLATFGIGMAGPLAKAEEASPVAIHLDLSELAVNDMIWSMIDPNAVLPHDPITAQLDLSGKGKILTDMFPAEAAATTEEAMPFELSELSLDKLNILLAGASLTGTGAFTFNNADLESFGGFPAPVGSMTLQGSGINGLLDKVQSMGMPIEEQLMGFRMMLGMFATVTGEDELESKIEANQDGSVLVNGQRIK